MEAPGANHLLPLHKAATLNHEREYAILFHLQGPSFLIALDTPYTNISAVSRKVGAIH
jgi:hypothetical protein